jgi:hypothetical protein
MGPLLHFAAWKALYFSWAAAKNSLLALTRIGQPQPTTGKVEALLHSSVEPLSQPRAFSAAAS